jgi:sensor histidine kinase YesM
LGKQIEIQNEIFLTNKVSEQRKLELQEIERQNKIKPHFVFNFAQSDSSSNKITLKNNGATARNVRIEENSNDYIRARILKSGEETENGEKIEIALTKKSMRQELI